MCYPKSRWTGRLTVILVGAALGASALAERSPASGQWLSLDGQWRFALDPNNQGITGQWYTQTLQDQVRLPGTTDENHKGRLNERRETGRLTRVYTYAGAAWYQRDVDVPAQWQGKRVVLVLERTKTSQLWVDGKDMDRLDSFVAAHEYDLGSLTIGPHRLTLRVSNNEYPHIGDPHQISDQTQTNWNGVIGRIGLLISDPVWIDDVQVYPNVGAHQVRVRVEVGNASGHAASGTLTLSATPGQGTSPSDKPQSVAFSAAGDRTVLESDYVLGDTWPTWDEFSPTVSRLSVSLEEAGGARDQRKAVFGLREFRANGTQFQINGRPTFLRGKHDACVFPLTGYPPMDTEGWLRVFRIARSYGLNHYRFHTWCPPEAAFEAADQLGIYLQPELPNWQAFGEPGHDDFLRAEGQRILRAFGNHPSFVMLSLGNELGGRQERMAPFIQHLRALDSRHLYAQGTNNWFPKPDPGDDYYCAFQYNGRKIRGSFATVDAPLGHVQTGPASTMKDYGSEIAEATVPVMGHEIGEYQVAPDFREIPRYTGVLAPGNLEILRNRLEERGMLDQADDFLRASGALAVLCYREDIEAALRTRGFGGFQMLDLQDFPGQGTALVGILNAFMESKGLVEPAAWRQFCSETVPLVRMAKVVWTNSETFSAGAQVAHYGGAAIADAAPLWTLRDVHGQVLASSRLSSMTIPQGTVTAMGEISIPLRDIPSPCRLSLTLAIEGTQFSNSYDLWVYAQEVSTDPGQVTLSRTLDDKTRQVLASGGRVLLLPRLETLTKAIAGAFACDFWNFGMFKGIAEDRKMPVAPGTLGILCDPRHPALAEFPSESHSNWQWFNLLQNSRALILDSMPKGFRPIVQVIDNYERAHRLGTVIEGRVGKGKVVICAIDLPGQQDRPEARQLLSSLLRYMNSDGFNPATVLDEDAIQDILQ